MLWYRYSLSSHSLSKSLLFVSDHGTTGLNFFTQARTLNDQSLDNEFKALALTLPTAE
jgi:hypothetical protein